MYYGARLFVRSNEYEDAQSIAIIHGSSYLEDMVDYASDFLKHGMVDAIEIIEIENLSVFEKDNNVAIRIGAYMVDALAWHKTHRLK